MDLKYVAGDYPGPWPEKVDVRNNAETPKPALVEQRYYLFRKSLRKARLRYGREFMTEADRAAVTLLTDEQLCQIGHMPDFGEAIAAWYKTLGTRLYYFQRPTAGKLW